MTLPATDINSFFENFASWAQEVDDAWTRLALGDDDEESPEQLLIAIAEFASVVTGIEEKDANSLNLDIEMLGSYGQELLDKLIGMAEAAKMNDSVEEMEQLALPIAAWVARNGGELKNLPPMVNALAYLANNLQSPEDMAQLCDLMNKLIEAVSPSVFEDEDPTDNNRPWRVLLLNRAIVATRSHSVKLIEPAYDSIVELLPIDAPSFFEEGIQQMDILGYPEHVRDIMNHYYLLHSVSRTLH